MAASDSLVIALRATVGAILRSLLGDVPVRVACLVVSSRDASDRECVLTWSLAGSPVDASIRQLLDECETHVSRAPYADIAPGELLNRLTRHPMFEGRQPHAVTLLKCPPLSAALVLGSTPGEPPAVASMTGVLECSRQLQAALQAYAMCQAARAQGHELAFIGFSPPFLRLADEIRKIAAHDGMPVLISGERGAGKEAVAYAVHYHSARRSHPFVVVNAAALPPELYAAELFGCRKGAFTGAVEDRRGRFEVAEGGTLFFDEITEMPRALRAGLLRAFDHGEIQKLGETRAVRTNVRLIAATNRDLDALVRERRFPPDLYDRICALQVTVPPLRERREDIPVLAEYYLRRYQPAATEDRQKPEGPAHPPADRSPCLDDEVRAALMEYPWPGNVRELKNVMARLSALSEDGPITRSCLAGALSRHPDAPQTDGRLETAIREHILATLQRTRWNKSAAARTLGIPLSTLVSKMKRLRIEGQP